MADQVWLPDGTEAWVLPLLHSDRERFVEEFEALSPDSRRRRFLSPVVHLSDALLQSLVDDVDGIDHVALVLFAATDADDFEPVAIGRMVRYPDLPDAADIAVTVKDSWQGRGVASALLPVLLERRPAGVTHVLTEVAADNPASLAMLHKLGPVTRTPTGHGGYDVEVDLVGAGPRHPSAERVGHRLHPVLEEPWRLLLRQRDRVCPWLQ
ncbi:GNAT family N-acetyltransferase [Nocardioides rotundus]|uniref:GNAT family N-acetyltransferase n=2 Tax=Bacteria TaxID=2 RepID=UPI001CBB9BBB|nr:GNAT family N-acetyltransferase [Nocardioides rotundus]UAL30233.1 GNAT family N-acetyltransferase [Nocardioides rotundus]